MKKFPGSIPLPQYVFDEREKRLKEILMATRMGVLVRSVLIVFLLAGFLYFRANVLLFDVMAMLLDVGSSFLLIYSFRLASRPPDHTHPLGHGRFEPLAALIFGVVVITLGCVMGVGEIKNIWNYRSGDPIRLGGWIVPLLSVLALEWSYRRLKKTAEELKAPALLAEAYHFRMDSVSSLIALSTFGFIYLFPHYAQLVDHMGALAIAGLIIFLGLQSVKENMHQLVDSSPSKEYFDLVANAALKVRGVHATEKTKIQIYGPDAHVAIDIELDPHMSVEEAHLITQEVRAEIQKAWPSVQDVIVHVEPFYENDH